MKPRPTLSLRTGDGDGGSRFSYAPLASARRSRHPLHSLPKSAPNPRACVHTRAGMRATRVRAPPRACVYRARYYFACVRARGLIIARLRGYFSGVRVSIASALRACSPSAMTKFCVRWFGISGSSLQSNLAFNPKIEPAGFPLFV